MDKIFLRSQFNIHYRNVHKLNWYCETNIDYTMLFLLEGRLEYHVGDQTGSISSQEALLLNPGIQASAHGQNVEYLQLALSPSFLFNSALRIHFIHTGSTIVFRAFQISDEKLFKIAIDLAEELKEAEAGQELAINSLLDQIVIHLLRRHSNAKRAEELELSRVGLVDRRIRRAVELMHTHLENDLPIEEIAAAAHLSTFHFSRLFKKLTGTTPHAYLAMLRTSQAQKLLAETDLSITEIGARVGYTNPSHFAKVFRQATGLSPRDFRAALIERQ
jgi:AraC family transcriptional regulator